MLSRLAGIILLLAGSLHSDIAACPDEIPPHERALPSPLVQLQGYWQDPADPDYLLAVEGTRLIVGYKGRVREVVSILGADEREATLCHSGREVQSMLRYQDGKLLFRDPFRETVHGLARIAEKPVALCLSSLRLPEARPLPATRVEQIQKELYERSRREQILLRPFQPTKPTGKEDLPWLQTQSSAPPESSSPSMELQLADQIMKNTEHLRDLLLEVGWIDVKRFGHGASSAAFLIVQHSWDVALMTAVLPRLKEDVDSGLMGADAYALLFDRLQLSLGLRQRYGTQIARDERKQPFVLPVEDPARVEELRRKLNLTSLAEYVKVFGGSEVRFSSDCQPRIP